ncbi:short-chain dehydrogenase [Pseudomonas fluorescens]|uniref:Short-chain dehydrogenase n=1 Tax=Pseudomonas fluorescens TaxID=294 RepID=A0A1T2ZA14_PSEFL|nr:SDR family oxidoreductase [Pseudomonas fluorescens]OPB00938.1 short-chain dehydrogenase [Pseudomonas fluorescens]
MTNLKGKVALITGSGRGLGRAIAERYAQLGADIVVNYAGSEKAALDTVKRIEEIGARALAIKADVSKQSEIDRLFDMALEHFGHLDIVVANAGLELVGRSAIAFDEDDFDRLFAVNTKGAILTMQRAARDIGDGGRIIYVGSSTTAFPMPGHALYGSSKMAPRFFVEVLAKEIGVRGVTVNSILPTATEGAGVSTNGAREEVKNFISSSNPMGRMGNLDDTANAAEYLAGDLASYISGQHLLISGGAPA